MKKALEATASEYALAVVRWYKGHISGWLLSIVAIRLAIAPALFADDPSGSAEVIKWSAVLTVLAAIYLFLMVQCDAWKEERGATIGLVGLMDPTLQILSLRSRTWKRDGGETGNECWVEVFNSTFANSLEQVQAEIIEIAIER